METVLKSIPKLRGGDKFFLPGVGRDDFDQVKETLVEIGGPIGIAVSGGGYAEFGGVKILVPVVEISSLRLLVGMDYNVPNGEDPVSGVIVSLNTPDHQYLVCAQNAYEKLSAGARYNTGKFLKDYARYLIECASEFFLENIKVKKLAGISGQAIGWISAKEDEIHLHPKTVMLLLKQDERLREETTESANGLVVLVSRYPTASPEGIYPYAIRVNPRVPEGKVAIHPVVLEERHGGDEDGDILYPLIPTNLVWKKETQNG